MRGMIKQKAREQRESFENSVIFIIQASVSGYELSPQTTDRDPWFIRRERMAQERSEKVFYAEGNITVTSTRVMADGDLYTMNTIASSKVRGHVLEDRKKKLLRDVCLLGSLLLGFLFAFLLWQGPGFVEGLVLGLIVWIAGSIATYIYIKPKYTEYKLYVGTNAGELPVMSSRDESLVRQVDRAIADAIAFRG